jgi:glycosyltransferase XagB
MGVGEWGRADPIGGVEVGDDNKNLEKQVAQGSAGQQAAGDVLLKSSSFADAVGLPPDIAFLERHFVVRDALYEAAEIARRKGMAASEVLIGRGVISRQHYLRALASHIGAEYLDAPPDATSVAVEKLHSDPVTALFRLPRVMRFRQGGGAFLAIAPEQSEPARLIESVRDSPQAGSRICLIESSKLRHAWFDYFSPEMLSQACRHLMTRYPAFSANPRLSYWQGFTLAIMGALLAAGLLLAGDRTLLALFALSSVFYTASTLLRAYLIVRLDSVEVEFRDASRFTETDEEDLPVYSVLSALLEETDQVAALVEALDALDWPRSRREIFLVCESRDQKTIDAIGALDLPDGFRLVICPDAEPRTKPKALNYALPLTSGEFIVIYDAEDRPHPGQLREAYEEFRRNDEKLACVQAPLAIYNDAQNWLTTMFAFEYDVLFRGILPVLASLKAPMPLGGTSNHFRTEILRTVGSWDPHNVTEDADLGIRLARHGYRCGTISLPTLEEAPPNLGAWRKQRSRWLKGWIQTMLVHWRNPLRTARQLGWRSSLILHLFLTSNVVSVIAHPFLATFTLYQLYLVLAGYDYGTVPLIMFGAGFFTLAAGYTTYGCFACALFKRIGPSRRKRHYVSLPFYWLLISYAGWRGLLELFHKPFHWEKTEHGMAMAPPCAHISVDGEIRFGTTGDRENPPERTGD